jgi:peptide/nickel transport system permease protein/oligopeptide transport system permease protein
VLQFIPVFIGATLIIFSMVFLIPGDPIRALSGDRPLPESVQAELRDQYNLDDPFMVQYGKYMGVIPEDEVGFDGLLQGDFGRDFRGREVREIMSQSFPVTLRLTVIAFVFEIIVGLIAGVLAGLRRGSFIDNLVRLSTILVISIPIFVLGYVFQLLFGLQLGWFPISGVQQGWFSYLLPGFVLGAVSLAYIARLTRTSLVENLRADYVRTATAKGLSRGRVVGLHTLRNSLIPVVTYLGVDFGALIGGAIVTETIFNLPGVGRAVFQGIIQQEGAVVVGIITVLTLIFVVANLLVDILYGYLDPRIRYD